MQSGIISLKPLYDFVRKHPESEALYGRSKIGVEYGKEAKRVVQTINEYQGFYLWGRYDKKGLWHNGYLGKAGFGKTSHLRARIFEELKDERSFLWRAVLSEKLVLKAGKKHYPSMWKTYQHHWNRALLKAGVTHIVWVSDSKLSNSHVANVESDLIETLNPFANKHRPNPPNSLQQHTHKVIGLFREAIHGERKQKYKMPLITAD